jgi:hypothetical protein
MNKIKKNFMAEHVDIRRCRKSCCQETNIDRMMANNLTFYNLVK